MTYFEQRTLDRWQPCTAPIQPRIKGDRLSTGENTAGVRIRGVKEILPVHEGLSLSELQAAYGGSA